MVDPVEYGINTLRGAYQAGSQFLDRSQQQLTEALGRVDWSQPDPATVLVPLRSPGALVWQRIIDSVYQYPFRYGVGLGAMLVVGLGAYRARTATPPKARRRVPKLANGARRDVVLVVGSPTEPLTRLICLDFEKRGFIVYLTLLEANDVRYVESNPITDDMNYLNLFLGQELLQNLTNHLESQIGQFGKLLQQPVTPFPGASSHKLRLVLVVFSPLLHFPLGPVELTAMSTWTRLNTRFVLTCQLLGCGVIQLVRRHEAKVVVLTPTITSLLLMPYHAAETVYTNQTQALFTTLAREMRPLGILVTQVRIGNLHLSQQVQDLRLKISQLVNLELSAWTQEMKQLYGQQFVKLQYRLLPIKATGGKGTRLRDLYAKLFDIIYTPGRAPAVVYCGTGARAYDYITRWFPQAWIDIYL